MSSHEIKAIRMQLGISQERLGAMLGVTAGTINRWEAGKHVPSDLSLNKIEKLKSTGVSNEK